MSQRVQSTHRVTLAGESRLVNGDNYQTVVDDLIAKTGADPKSLRVEPLVAEALGVGAVTPPRGMAAVVPPAAPAAPVGPGGISEAGAARSQAARFEMRANGFAPKPPVYAVGSRVNEWGVRNAESSRLKYDQLARVSEYCGALIKTVLDECRMDVAVERLSQVRMQSDGMVVRDRRPVPLTEHAFSGLLSRTGIGAHSYLSKCPPVLRATNVNFWQEQAALAERVEEAEALRTRTKWEPKDAKFRTRVNQGQREVFAVVSGSYGAFDVDQIATALSMASPPDARGSVVYDGTRAKFEVLFHTNIAPAEFVAGEFFKAGVLVRTDDTGGGAIRISAVVWQNLCLNLIILDECVQEIAAIRHVGSVEALAAKFREGFSKALGSIEQFLEKWNYALQDDCSSDLVDADHRPIPISEVLPGLFNGIVERELVPVRGQRKDIVQGLVRMYEADTSAARAGKDFVSRAAVVNAFTRYAHEVNDDPFEQDQIERAAGGLLEVTPANRELPFEPVDF